MQDYISVLEKVRKVFIYADTHNWSGLVSEVFAPEVLLDYASFGGAVETLPATQIATNWKSFFSKMEHTHHQLGNELVTVKDNTATFFVYGTAGHYKTTETNDNLWTVAGTYDFELEKIQEDWKVTKMKFNFKYQLGNTNIPAMP